jgi:DNA-binding transcriptional ArsR family regulator
MQLVAEPRRQAILQLIWNQERSAGEITEAFNVSFSAVSQHLAKLRGAGIVEVRREGRMRFYRARKEALGPLGAYLETLWGDRLLKLKSLAEAEERKASDESKG